MSLVLIAKKSGKQVDLAKVAKNDKYVELAVPEEEYYLVDTATGKTPEDVKVTRVGVLGPFLWTVIFLKLPSTPHTEQGLNS